MNEVLGYLRTLSRDERKILTSIRTQVLRLVPGVEERLSRGVPFFYYRNKRVVGFRSSKNHLSFFIMDGNVLDNHKTEISAYEHGSTVIRFTAENPISNTLVRKLVFARLQEIESRANQRN